MKIAVIGKFNQLNWLENITDAFSRLGHNVLAIKYNKLGFVADLKRNILKKKDKNKASKFNVEVIEKQLERFDPELIVIISPLLLTPNLSLMLDRFERAIKVAWVGDKFRDEQIELLQNYDQIYFTDTGFIDLIDQDKNDHFDYLPLAYNDRIFNDRKHKRSNNIVFIGSSTENRNEFIQKLDSSVELTLIGNRWRKRLPELNNHNISIINKKLSIAEVATEYNHHNFVLNMKHAENVINGLNMRTFEALATGACMLQDNVKDVALHFEAGKDLMVYETADDLSIIWNELVRDTNKLKTIQKNAIEAVETNHTYVHRAEKILDNLGM